MKADNKIGDVKGAIRDVVQGNFQLKDKDDDAVPNHIAIADVRLGKKRNMGLELCEIRANVDGTLFSSLPVRSKPY